VLSWLCVAGAVHYTRCGPVQLIGGARERSDETHAGFTRDMVASGERAAEQTSSLGTPGWYAAPRLEIEPVTVGWVRRARRGPYESSRPSRGDVLAVSPLDLATGVTAGGRSVSRVARRCNRTRVGPRPGMLNGASARKQTSACRAGKRIMLKNLACGVGGTTVATPMRTTRERDEIVRGQYHRDCEEASANRAGNDGADRSACL
jgi:hypothetical protein